MLRPTNNNIVIDPLPVTGDLPKDINSIQRWCKVLAVGPGVITPFGKEIISPPFEEGDYVYAMAHGLLPIHTDAELVCGDKTQKFIINELDIILKTSKLDNQELFTPIGNFVLIEKLEVPDIDIYIPSDSKMPSNRGRVIKLGTGWRTMSGDIVPFQVSEGDIVIFDPLRTVKVDATTIGFDKQYHLIMHTDIFGVLEND